MYSLIGTVLFCLCLIVCGRIQRIYGDPGFMDDYLILSDYEDSRHSRCTMLRDDNNATNRPKKEQLEFYLLCGEHARVRPVKDENSTLNVDVHFTPTDLEIQEPEEVMRVTGIVHLTWMHEHLRWDPKDFESITEFAIRDGSDFWTPRFSRQYDSSTRFRVIGATTRHHFTNVTIRSDGLVSASSNSQMNGGCKHYIRGWPFDKWECPFNLARFSKSDDRLPVAPKPFDPVKDVNMSALQDSSQWEIVSNPPFSLVPSSDPVIQLSVTLQKDPSHYKYIFVVPGIVSFLLSMMSFWLADHIYCRLMITRFAILVQLVLLLCVFGVVTNSEKKAVGISLQSRKSINGVALLDFYIDSLWSSLVALLLAIVHAVLTKKTIIPPKYITRKIDGVAMVPYVGPVFAYIFINDSVVSGHSLLDNLEGALATDTTRKDDQEWKTIMNILNRGAFFIIVFYFCIRYVL